MVDEAHRLNEKSGLYGNLGGNQIKEIIAAAKCVVFFLDEDQVVTLSDIGRKDEIRRWAQQQGAGVQEGTLASQFRCNGSDGYLAGLDDTLQIRKIANDKLDTREFDLALQGVTAACEEARIILRSLIPDRVRLSKTSDGSLSRALCGATGPIGIHRYTWSG